MVWVQRCNPFILIASLLLTGFGVVSVYSASAIVAMERHQDPYFFLKRQLFYAILGVVGMLGVLQIDYRHLQRWSRLSLVLTLMLLGLLFVPTLTKEAGGAKRWLQVGRLSFQPAELCKLTLVLYLAHRLAVHQPWRSRFLRHYLPLAGVIGALFACTLLQPDFGTAVLLLGIAAIVLFLGGVPLRYLVQLASCDRTIPLPNARRSWVSLAAPAGFLGPLVSPFGGGISDCTIAVGLRERGLRWCRSWGRSAEAVFLTGSTHGFRLRGHR